MFQKKEKNEISSIKRNEMDISESRVNRNKSQK